MLKELVLAFSIMGVCVVIHVAGIVLVADVLVKRRLRLAQDRGPLFHGFVLTTVFVIIVILHMTEASFWALFYFWNGLFNNLETSLYFSLQSYSTVGYGDVSLPGNWRLLGTVEALSGGLLCGLSAAFLFAIIATLFQLRATRDQ